MARRRLTLKRIDPWSVLKFGFVANLALLAIWLLGAGIIWFFVRQLGLIEKVCEIAGDVGFVECGVNGGNLFRALLLLGLLGTVIQTGLVVFLAFLHNLIADLVGGISFTYTEEGGAATTSTRSSSATTTRQASAAESRTGAGAGAAAARSAGTRSTGSGGPPPPIGSERASRAEAERPSTDPPAPARPSSDVPRDTSATPPSSTSAPAQQPERSGGPVRPGSSAPSAPAPTPEANSPAPGGGSSPDRGGSSPDWDLFGPRGSGGSGGSRS